MSSSQKEKTVSPIELFVTIILGLLAIGAFIIQIVWTGDKTTSTETSLFNLLQFVITLGFAWFSTRAISKVEFEKSIKKFAISAYRRISDIEKMNHRLHKEIIEMMSLSPADDQNNLRVVEAIVYDTAQVVRSSIDDWGDVIGNELIALEKIRRLEHEKREIKSFSERIGVLSESNHDSKLEMIENQLSELRSSLPSLLQITSKTQNELDQFSADTAAAWLVEKHIETDGLLLKVVAGSDYSFEPDPKKLNFNQKLFINKGSGERGLEVFDKEGNILGRVLNLLPLEYDQTAKALEVCYGSKQLIVEFVDIMKDYHMNDHDFIHYQVKVLSPPVYENRVMKKRKASKRLTKRST